MNTVNLYEYCVLDTAHLQVNQVVTMSSSIEKYCQVTMCFADVGGLWGCKTTSFGVSGLA